MKERYKEMPRCNTCGTETEDLVEDPVYFGKLCPDCLKEAIAQAKHDYFQALEIYFDFLKVEFDFNEAREKK